MRISVTKIRIRPLILGSLIILATVLIFPWRSPSSQSPLCLWCPSWSLLPHWLHRLLFIEYLWILCIWLLFSIASIWSSPILALHLSMHPLVHVHLILYPRLNMLILLSGLNNSSPWIHQISLVSGGTPSSLRSSSAWSQFGHLWAPIALSVGIRTIFHPRLLVTFTWRTVTHYNGTSFFASTNNTMRFTIIIVLNVTVFIMRCTSSMMILAIFNSLLLNWFISVISSRYLMLLVILSLLIT